jgi:hypothetical protein
LAEIGTLEIVGGIAVIGGSVLKSILDKASLTKKIDNLEKYKVSKETCEQCQKNTDDNFKHTHEKIDTLTTKVDKGFEDIGEAHKDMRSVMRDIFNKIDKIKDE